MKLAIALCAITLAGCASGDFDYSGPQPPTVTTQNSVIVDASKDEAWDQAIPHLGKRFFVINNMDRGSGLINLSYAGDPQKYVDCGQIRTTVSNLKGTRRYAFAGASPDETYEVLDNQHRLFTVHRALLLEGRTNLVFEAVDPRHTRITVSTRYVLTRTVDSLMAGVYAPSHLVDSITFNTGGSATFGNSITHTECSSTGLLEGEILSILRG
jgi:hypothetical protein